MHFNNLIFLSSIVPALAAVTTVTIESTVFYCPCTSTLSILASGSASHSLSLGANSTGTSSITKLAGTSGTATSIATAPTSTSPGSCIPVNGDCTNETQDFYCCGGSVCDVGLDTPTCVVDNTASSSPAAPPATTPAGTSASSASSPTSTSPGSCIPFNGDCTNETEDFYCCDGSVCDVGLDTPTCVADDTTSSVAPAPTSPSTAPAAPSATAPGACIPLNGDCTNQTEDYFCCDPGSCDVASNICTSD